MRTNSAILFTLTLLSFVGRGSSGFAGDASSAPELAGTRPNVVILLCDDLGYGDLGCYGHPHIQTPNLDRLASGGVRWTHCYSTAPVCSPSRVGLLTGRSPNRAGVYDWIPGARNRQSATNNRDRVHMRSSEWTIPACLQAAGYRTAMAGKWHCNSQFNSDKEPRPSDFGFDHWLATHNNAAPSHRNPTNYVRNGVPVGPIEGYSCHVVVDEAIRFLEASDSSQPFFLFLSFHEPHEPVASPEALVDSYRTVADNEDEAHYFANVHNVDLAVGRLVDDLRRRDAWKDTLILFTSDNGPETLLRYGSARRSYGRATPLRGMKLHTTEAGFRVCGIAHWPASIAGGRTSDQVVSALDFLPTLQTLAGGPPPKRKLDGTDLSPWMVGQPVERDRPLVWAYYNAINDRRVAMRSGQYKVLARIRGAEKISNLTEAGRRDLAERKLVDIQVFDVTRDIGEQNDLADDEPALTERLTAELVHAYGELLDDSHTW